MITEKENVNTLSFKSAIIDRYHLSHMLSIAKIAKLHFIQHVEEEEETFIIEISLSQEQFMVLPSRITIFF